MALASRNTYSGNLYKSLRFDSLPGEQISCNCILINIPFCLSVTEVLVQRLPLMGVAAGVCFILGVLFGAICALTISRGTRQCSKKKHRRKTPTAVQVQPDPTYTELTVTVADSSNNGRVRQSNDYMELNITEPRSSTPIPPDQTTAHSDTNGVGLMATCNQRVCMPCDGPNDEFLSPCGLLPEDTQHTPQQGSCIEVDLDELERAVMQQED